MLTLYVKTGCPFCRKVLEVGQELGITFEEKNVADPSVAAELVARGGKKQEPYLVDLPAQAGSERGLEMYESSAIIAYLREHYTKPA
jgi:glutaredoxin